MKKTLIAALFTAGLLVHQSANAWVATEATQIMNNIQLVMQYANQVQQLQTQANALQVALQNAKQNPESLLRNPQGIFNQLASVVNQGEALGLSSARIESTLKNTYGSKYGGNYLKEFNQWSRTTKDSIKSALMSAGSQFAGYQDETAAIQKLAGLSASATGHMQAITTGNEIALSMVDQLQKLRNLQMSQMQAQSAFMMQQQASQEAEVESSKKLLNYKWIDENDIK